jgi:hypothetical protein
MGADGCRWMVKAVMRVRKEIQVGCKEIDGKVASYAVRDNFTKVGSV